jgi:hypothetical protein
MAVYVDPMQPTPKNRNWRYSEGCHLVADSRAELIRFARRIGLHPDWIQKGEDPIHVHFDLTRAMRVRAVAAGALQFKTCRDLGYYLMRKKYPARAGTRTIPKPETKGKP